MSRGRSDLFGIASRAEQSAAAAAAETERRREEGNPDRPQDCRRCGGRPARAERSVPDLGARGPAEGAGQQAVSAVLRDDRPVEGDRRQGVGLLARRVEERRRRGGGRRGKKDDKKDDKNKKPEYAYEDINTVTLPAGQTGADAHQPIVHGGAGDYDVYVVVKEPTPEKAPKNAPPPKVSLIKQTRRRCPISGTTSSTRAR